LENRYAYCWVVFGFLDCIIEVVVGGDAFVGGGMIRREGNGIGFGKIVFFLSM
jgi:hypothetical protein